MHSIVLLSLFNSPARMVSIVSHFVHSCIISKAHQETPMYTGVLRRAEYLAPCTHPFCSCGHSAQVCGRRPHKLLAVITIRCFSRFCSSSQPLISHEAHVALYSFLNTSTLQRSRMILEIFCVVCVADLIIQITDLALTQISLLADHRRRGATGATPHQPRRPGGVDHRSHDHDTTDLVISSSRYQRSDGSFLFSFLFPGSKWWCTLD